MLNRSGGTPQDQFQAVLLTVVGQAFAAAGYTLEERPRQWAAGQFRFVKLLGAPLQAFIEVQLLHVTASEWSVGQGSRFRVTLTRTDQPTPSARSVHPAFAQRTLAALVVQDFAVAILPSADHWWTFTDVTSLGRALAEAGHLVVGYGMPWLDGTLAPPPAASGPQA